MVKKYVTIDGNTAASKVAYAFSEVAAIYPITPSSPMGEMADQFSAKDKKNMFGQKVEVIEMQSEGGAAGAIHGSLSAGAMTTTFTSSQGLLLMIPNMFKIAGEMLPTVFHVAARSLACQSLSIFADHSDVMSVRDTGFAIISAANVQEVQDLAIISHLSTLESSIPFLSFFDGFRTSHQIEKIEQVEIDEMKSMLNMENVERFRSGALTPERPVVKVGAENPDVYFQGRETVNKYYDAIPSIVKKYMKLFEQKTGRKYNLFDYAGDPKAKKIIISMASSVDTVEETVNYLNKNGEKVGAIKIRMYRPFSVKDFIDTIPKSVKKIAVLDRTKEPGSIGEPLYLDTVAALKDKGITIIGGRYGLSSKEFTPTMVKGVFDHLDGECFHDFTVGIIDDVTNRSIKLPKEVFSELQGIVRCKFWGFGSDGTVSANKNAIKIIGQNTDKYVQAYFSYDSKKAGGITVSHLRFGDKKIQSQYFLTVCDFVALHKPSYIGQYDILEDIKEEGIFLINSPLPTDQVFSSFTEDMQKTIIEKKIKVYTIDALKIAKEVGLGHRINTVMQSAFFKISGIIPEDPAIQMIKDAIHKQFKHKGEEIVKMNWACVDKTNEALAEIKVPDKIDTFAPDPKLIPDDASDFAKDVILPIMKLKGDNIPVSKMPLNGAVPLSTNKLEKRGIADSVPHWKPEECAKIQCTMCAYICPHAAIRTKQIEKNELENAPKTFRSIKSNTKNDKDLEFTVQIYPEDCTGCEVCVEVCPSKPKALEMVPIEKSRKAGENENERFFNALSDKLDGTVHGTIKESQLRTPLFEFSGACAGCGETPYIKLATQLFGDRMIIANATGCTSIYGGTFPTVPYCTDSDGKGPAWANSLFEDNAEYGFGFRLAINANRQQLKDTIQELINSGTTNGLKDALSKMIEVWDKTDDEAKEVAKQVVSLLPEALSKVYGTSEPLLKKVNELKYFLVDKSVWIIGGDGWAYDIGYGGLDHVIAQGRNVNILVLDTEVYSNTGGQTSKATPRAATAKFSVAGKETPKKNLGMMCMAYSNVYVASVDMGANMTQVVKVFKEAEEYPGTSIIIAYSPCVAHGYNLKFSESQGKKAGQSGYWPIYRYNPTLVSKGENPFIWESSEPSIDFKDYIMNEMRYKSLKIGFPDSADKLYDLAEKDAKWRNSVYKGFADSKKKEPDKSGDK